MKAREIIAAITIGILSVFVYYLIYLNTGLNHEVKDLKNSLKYYKAADSLSQITIQKCLEINKSF